MAESSPPSSYTAVAKLLHWSIAGLIALVLGIAALPNGPLRASLYGIHQQAGVIVLGLMIIRLGYRLRNKPPAWLDTLSKFEQGAAQAVHFCLYGLLVLTPIAGIIRVQARNNPVVVLGIDIPNWITPGKELYLMAKTTHQTLAYGFLFLLLIHLGSVLRHHYWRKDATLHRMLPRWISKNKS